MCSGKILPAIREWFWRSAVRLKGRQTPMYRGLCLTASLFYFLVLPRSSVRAECNQYPGEKGRVLGVLPRSRYGQNLLVLDEARVGLEGGKWKNIRKHVNGAAKNGYTILGIEHDMARAVVGRYIRQRRYGRSIEKVMEDYYLLDPGTFLGLEVLDRAGEGVALLCGFFSEDVFNLTLSITLQRGDSRWLAHEELLRSIRGREKSYVRVSGLLAMNHGDCIFSEQLGYKHYNLSK